MSEKYFGKTIRTFFNELTIKFHKNVLRPLRQACSIAACNFRQWHKNPRIFITFALAFILCFLLSDKIVAFSEKYDTTTQILEPFIWTFGDSSSILLASLLLIFLFADMPFLSSGTPFYLLRISRKVWLLGQAIYIMTATFFYMTFILLSTALVCMKNAFPGNLWSTASAIIGYGNAGKVLSLPITVKTMEMTTPYPCAVSIFLLMLCYAQILVFLMLLFNLIKGQLAGVISVFVFSLYGFLLSPSTLQTIFQLEDKEMYQANVFLGWVSPLNHATYQMHNFGYDLLPTLHQTYLISGVVILLLFAASLNAVRRYNFLFTGTA